MRAARTLLPSSPSFFAAPANMRSLSGRMRANCCCVEVNGALAGDLAMEERQAEVVEARREDMHRFADDGAQRIDAVARPIDRVVDRLRLSLDGLRSMSSKNSASFDGK